MNNKQKKVVETSTEGKSELDQKIFMKSNDGRNEETYRTNTCSN